MHRSNPIAFASGSLFLAALFVVYAWSHEFPRRIQFWTTEAWLAGVTILGFFLWLHGTRLRALVDGVPTSRIASAPQGYVELVGRAANARKHLPDAAEFYLWKRTQFASRAGASGVRTFPFNLFYLVTSIDVTEAPFCIEDETGHALIVPSGAEVICARREVDYDGDRKVIREHILDGDPLYVLGQFSTSRQEVDIASLTERLINDWKMDREQLRRVDANRDGYLLWGGELMEMHKAARQAAEQHSADAVATGGVNILSRSSCDRRFVISTVPADKLAGHYHWYLGIGLLLFFSGLAGSVVFFRAFLSEA